MNEERGLIDTKFYLLIGFYRVENLTKHPLKSCLAIYFKKLLAEIDKNNTWIK